MATATEPLMTAYKLFRSAFETDRRNFTRDERRAAIEKAKSLVDDLECELWADEHGLDIPDRRSDEWMAIYREYLRRNE